MRKKSRRDSNFLLILYVRIVFILYFLSSFLSVYLVTREANMLEWSRNWDLGRRELGTCSVMQSQIRNEGSSVLGLSEQSSCAPRHLWVELRTKGNAGRGRLGLLFCTDFLTLLGDTVTWQSVISFQVSCLHI